MANKENRKTKTNHQTGWHKRVVNPTTNFPMDSHKAFCERCFKVYNDGKCPMTGSKTLHNGCNV